MAKRFDIRNSTAEFLIFMAEGKEDGVQVMYADETIWCTQDAIATLFDKGRSTIAEHLSNIFKEGELTREAVCRDFRQTATDGKSYNTHFRQWCTFVLRQYAIRGYVIDKKRMENGAFIGVDYFEQLLEEIREIRLSERNFYQKLTDIYATAIDYNRDAPATREFFKKVQNKMHYAVHGHTAAELIVERANADKEHMGLTTWAKAPDGKIIRSDVSIAKNYLKENELQALGRLVNAYLDIAKDMAERHIPMTMEDWAKRIDKFLDATDREILQDAGHVTAEYAKEYAESEFEKYRVIQDRLFRSDFDKLTGENPSLPLDTEQE